MGMCMHVVLVCQAIDQHADQHVHLHVDHHVDHHHTELLAVQRWVDTIHRNPHYASLPPLAGKALAAQRAMHHVQSTWEGVQVCFGVWTHGVGIVACVVVCIVHCAALGEVCNVYLLRMFIIISTYSITSQCHGPS